MTSANPKIAVLEVFEAALRWQEDVIRVAAVCLSTFNVRSVLAAFSPWAVPERELVVPVAGGTAVGGVRFPLGDLLAKPAAGDGVSAHFHSSAAFSPAAMR